MANTIDERVVSMKFDNKQFKSAASETMSVLKDLETKSNLKNVGGGLKDASNNLDALGASARNVDLGSISSGVDGATKGFSALKAMGVGALLSIGDKAVEVGGQIADAMLFRGARDGFQEYELQMNSVQTILANTAKEGTNIKQVNATLDDLNEYADKTIYNFAEMTRNIGTFTAAGVSLDTSAQSIKGIANLAAMSGSNSQQASTAMYQLSQAIAAGSVKLMDWNSVVNAGMGGQAFQEALWETGKAMDTLTEKSGKGKESFDDWLKSGGSFRESLSEEWITSDVLTSTLENFTGDLDKSQLMAKGYSEEVADMFLQMGENANNAATKVKTFSQLLDTTSEAIGSGWAETWRIVLGDFEEASELFTGISQFVESVVGGMSDARNKLLQGWKDGGGRDDLIAGFVNIFKALGDAIKPVQEAFREIIPPLTAERLISITKGFREFTESLKVSDTTAQNIKDTFKGVFSVFKLAGQIIGGVISTFAKLFGVASEGTGGILAITGALGRFITKLVETIDKSGVLQGIFTVLGGAAEFLTNALGGVLKVIGGIVGGGLDVLNGLFSGLLGSDFGSMFSGIENNGAVQFLNGLKDALVSLAEAVGGVASILFLGDYRGGIFGLGEDSGVVDFLFKIREAFTSVFDYLKGLDFNDILGGLFLGGFAVTIKRVSDLLKGLTEAISGPSEGAGLMDGFREILDGVTGSLTEMQNNIKANTILQIAAALMLLAIAANMLSKLDGKQLTTVLAGMAGMIAEMMAALTAMAFITKIGGIAMLPVLAGTLLMLSAAILVFSSAVKSMAELSWDELARGLVGVGVSLGLMVVALNVLPDEGKLIRSGLAMILLASAMLIMASAVKSFKDVKMGDVVKGLLGLAGSMAILIAALNFMPDQGKMISTGIGMILLASGIKILANAFAVFASLDISQVGSGLMGLAGALAATVIAIHAMPKDMLKTGAGLILISTGISILANAFSTFAGLDMGQVGSGIVGMAGALMAVTIAVNMMPKNLPVIAVGLFVVSAAIQQLANAFATFGGLSLDQVGSAMVGMAGSLLILAVAMKAMQGSLMGAAALFVAAAALGSLADAMNKMGSLSWGEVGKGLATLAGGLTLIIVAGLGAQFAAVGLAALALTLPLIAFGLGMLVPVMQALGSMSWESIGRGLLVLAGALTLVIVAGVMATPAAAGLLALSAALVALGVAVLGIGAGLLMLATALTMITALGSAAVAAAGVLGAALAVAVVGFIAGLVAAIPMLVGAIVELFLALLVGLQQIVDRGGPIIVDIIVKLLELAAEALVEAADILSEALLELILRIIENLEEWGPKIVEKFADFVIGMADALREKIPEVAQAMVDLYQTLWDTIAEKGPELVRITVEGFKELVSGVADELRNAGPKWLSEGISAANQLIRGIVSAIRNGTSKAINAVKDMAKKVIDKAKGVFQIKSPSRVFMKIGDHVVQGMANGITNNGSAIASSGAMAQGVIDEATNTLEINSPSKVFDSIGQNVGKGFNQGIKKSMGKSKNTMADHLDEMISTVIGRSYKMSDAARAFFNGFSNVLDGTFSEANLSKQMKHAEAQRAMLVKERKIKKMEEERAKKEKKEKIYEDVKEAKKALREAEEDKVNAKKDADQAAAENAKAEKEAKGKKKKANKEKKQKASDATKARRDAENREKKIKDARKNLEKAEWEREKYEYEMNGEECGIAFVDGVAKGFIKEEERIPSVIELFVDAVYGQLEKIKKKMDEQVQAWGAIRSVRGTFKEITKGLTDFRRALTRAANTTSDKSFIRNLGVAGDAIFGIVETLMGLWTVLDKLKPVLPSILSQFEHFAPQLAAAVAPIAPTLAKQLGGGLAAALPAIIGPAIQIVGGVLAVFGVLWDLGGDQRIVKWLDRIVLAVSTFLKTLPQRIGGFIQKLIKGLKWLVTDGIDFLVNMIMAIFDGVVAFIVATPQIVVDVIMALVDLAITLLTQSPVRLIKAVIDLVARVFVGLIQALPDLVVGLFKAFRDLGVGLVRAIVDSFWGIVDALKFVFFELPKRLFESIVAAVRGIVDAFFSTFRRIFRIGRPQSRRAGEEIIEDFSDGMNKRHETLGDRLLRPFRSLRDGVRKLFGIRSPSRVMSEMGGYVVEGFANGVAKNTHLVDNSMGGFQDALSKSVDQIIAEAEALANNDIVFTPELDMSLAESELSRFNDSVSTSFAYSNADLISSFGSNSEAVGGVVNNVTFNQTNTSPKPLSALEIYRNTDRLLEGAIR